MSKEWTAIEILRTWLSASGFDGLCSGECGCSLHDLMPCSSEGAWDCRPAYRIRCTEDCEGCIAGGGEGDGWCYTAAWPGEKRVATWRLEPEERK